MMIGTKEQVLGVWTGQPLRSFDLSLYPPTKGSNTAIYVKVLHIPTSQSQVVLMPGLTIRYW